MTDTIPGDARLGTITSRHPMAYHRAITFREAANHVLPFNPYRGMRLDDIARTDKGLLWLVTIYEQRLKQREDAPFGQSANVRETNGMLHVYLHDTAIAAAIAAARKA